MEYKAKQFVGLSEEEIREEFPVREWIETPHAHVQVTGARLQFLVTSLVTFENNQSFVFCEGAERVFEAAETDGTISITVTGPVRSIHDD